MSARSIVIDAVSGVVKRKISGDPTMFADQVTEGESLFAISGDDASFIDDGHLLVNEVGEWEVLPSAPVGFEIPDSALEYVAI